jgi:sialic acid synthase SpsE
MPIQLVAEVGTACNGSVQEALALADVVKASGADCIKYMLIGSDHFMADKAVEYTYRWSGGTKTVNMHQMFKGLEFMPNDWAAIVVHCRAIGLPWFLTVDYLDGITLAEDLGCPCYKLSAWDIRNYPLIRALAQTGKPLWIDLGPVVLGEVVNVLQEIGKVRQIPVTLLHSTHSGDPADANLRAIPFLKAQTGCGVGWSAPGRDWPLDALAMAAGAGCVEKRLCLDTQADSHHALSSLNPEEWTEWVAWMRAQEACLGVPDLVPSFEDVRQKPLWFTSITTAKDVSRGTVFTPDLLCAKRPGHGISPLYLERCYGKRAARDLPADTTLDYADLE